MEHNLSDRRKHARFELMDYAILTKDGSSDSTRSVIVDISLGGLQVRSRTPFVQGSKYAIEIGRGNASPVVVYGESLNSIEIDGSDLFSTGFRLIPTSAMERIEWVEYVHSVFKAQGEMLTG